MINYSIYMLGKRRQFTASNGSDRTIKRPASGAQYYHYNDSETGVVPGVAYCNFPQPHPVNDLVIVGLKDCDGPCPSLSSKASTRVEPWQMEAVTPVIISGAQKRESS